MGGLWVALALCCGVAGLPPGQGDSAPELVLEPGQERAAARLLGAGDDTLSEGWSVREVRAGQDRVRVLLAGPAGPVEVDLLAPDAGGASLIRARRGAFVPPPELPREVADALRRALDADGVALRWRRLMARSDPARASEEAARLSTRLQARTGQGGAADLGLASGVAGSDDPSALLAQSAWPPPGTLSRWLASAAPGAKVPCPPRGACPAAEVLRDLAAGRLDPTRLALWSDEPRLLARAAALAADTGRPELAGSLLAQALMAEGADPEATAVAARFGWVDAATISQTIPDDSTPLDPPPVLPWLALAALALALALAAGWRSGRAAERLALALGLLAAAALASWLQAHQPSPPTAPALASPWLELGRGTDLCRPSPPAIAPTAWQVLVRCPDGAASVRLSAADDGTLAAAVNTLGSSSEPSPALAQWLARVLRDASDAGLTLAPAAAAERPDSSAFASRFTTRRPLDRAALLLAGPTVLLALFAALALFSQALASLASHARAQPAWGRWLALAAAVAVVTHVVAPGRLVMVFDGYAQTQALIAMEPLRYGAGANWLYGPLLAFWPDHAAVQLANRVYGLVGLIALWALASRLWPARPALTTLLALTTATAPLLWRDHASESILVAPTALLLLGAFGVATARDRAFPLLLAAPCLAAAALSRPEFGPAALALAALVLATRRPRWDARGWLAAGLATLAALSLAPPHLALVRRVVAWLVETSALPGLDGLWPRAAQDFLHLGGFDVVLHVGPALLAAFVLASLFAGRDAWLALGLIALALAWTALTRVDLPAISIARVHAPPWLLFALVGALGADVLWSASARLPTRHARPVVLGLLALAWLATAAATLAPLYAPTNADTEELLLRATADHLPTGRVCLATLDETDPPPAGKTPRFFPYYLLANRTPAPTLTSLAALKPSAPACADGAFALLGVRCYMALREDATAGPPPPGAPMVAGCQAFADRHRLEPVVGYDAPNHGDHGFDLYPAGPTLRVGLYRVR
ncbi:MAG: hypothetical protein R3F39_23900 [Myxococcota bacterium]